MMNLALRFGKRLALVMAAAWSLPVAAWAGPPAQRLPSALLMFPFIEVAGDRDTRVEIVNLSGDPQQVQCFYVDDSCNEIGFFLFLTPYQPIAWLATSGTNDESSGTAAPPFFGTGELKCAVVPPRPETQFYNAIQGRATVFGTDGRTVSYNAVGFQRLSDGDFTGVLALNGTAYAQCPDRLHFDVLTDQPDASSDMVLVPCSQDLLLQIPTSLQVQLTIINEFETSFSASINVTCSERRALSAIAETLNRAAVGTDTAHVIVRGVTGPVIGLVIDAVPFAGLTGTAGNEPSFQGGRSATVVFP
jgi:hypothetical protein